MKVTFVAHGWENISIQYISSYLKQRSHEVALAYEQSLFDDKNYICIDLLAKVFDQKSNIVRQIVDTKPDIVGFSVMVFTYHAALKVAKELKKVLNVPIIFGGPHAMTCPERIISQNAVDIVCVGEGEHAMAELLDSMENGTFKSNIDGLWIKSRTGEIIKNKRRPLIKNLDDMPYPDKELFDPFVPIKNYYLAVTSRGCPYSCSYCSVSYLTELDKKSENYTKVRERSVDNVIEELKINKKKYDYKWIDFRNAVFSANSSWIIEFCEKYRKEINLPFRIFSHPLLIREDTSLALKEAGCFAVQIGLESYDPHVRCDILKRHETNDQIHKAIEILEKCKLTYSLDYILGLPNQEEKELKDAAELFTKLKYCYRISPFMISYLPKVPLVKYAIKHGMMERAEREKIEEGLHDNYMNKGSKIEIKKENIMNMYKLFFRSMSFMPCLLRNAFYKLKLYYIFKYIPFDPILRIFDLSMIIRDHDARAYVLNYWWWFKMRFKPDHPNYFMKKKNC